MPAAPKPTQQTEMTNSKGSLTGVADDNPVKGAMQLIDNKLRNLSKRQGRLEEAEKKTGGALTEDQKKALAKKEEVQQMIDFVTEMRKQLEQCVKEAEVAMKKKTKKDREQARLLELERAKEIFQVSYILGELGAVETRQDFEKGANGACKLSTKELGFFDELWKKIGTPDDDAEWDKHLQTAGETVTALLNDSNKPFVKDTNFAAMRSLIRKVNDSGYFAKKPEPSESEVETVVSPGSGDSTKENKTHKPEATNGNMQSPREIHNVPQPEPHVVAQPPPQKDIRPALAQQKQDQVVPAAEFSFLQVSTVENAADADTSAPLASQTWVSSNLSEADAALVGGQVPDSAGAPEANQQPQWDQREQRIPRNFDDRRGGSGYRGGPRGGPRGGGPRGGPRGGGYSGERGGPRGGYNGQYRGRGGPRGGGQQQPQQQQQQPQQQQQQPQRA